MESFKVYLAAIVTTVVAIAGPFAFTYAVASISPILGGPALAIGLVAFPGSRRLVMALADVVVVDHHDSYTQNLVHLLAEVTGRLPRVVQHDETDPDDVLRHSHVVLSPGPGRPDDPHDFAVGVEVLRRATRPVLGVCLGMQGLVTAYGGLVGRVRPARDQNLPLLGSTTTGAGSSAGCHRASTWCATTPWPRCGCPTASRSAPPARAPGPTSRPW